MARLKSPSKLLNAAPTIISPSPLILETVTELAARAAFAAAQAKRTLAGLKSEAERTRENDTSVSSSTEVDARFQIVGESPAMHVVFQIIGRAAVLDETVLIMGESGTWEGVGCTCDSSKQQESGSWLCGC